MKQAFKRKSITNIVGSTSKNSRFVYKPTNRNVGHPLNFKPFWFLIACDKNANSRLRPCVLVLCFLISENKVSRVSGSKWDCYSMHRLDCTYPHDCIQWIHLFFLLTPHHHQQQLQFHNFSFLINSPHHIQHQLCRLIHLKTYYFFESNVSVSASFIASGVHFGVGNYKAEGKYTFEKGPSCSPSKCEKSFLLLAPFNRGSLRKPSFDPTNFFNRKVMCKVQSAPLQQILPSLEVGWVCIGLQHSMES